MSSALSYTTCLMKSFCMKALIVAHYTDLPFGGVDLLTIW